ncbi:YcjX family protein [Cognatishimia sp. SS12]|uniref:YcjX family protein n=1 Tax=Cognatishimia sp. SS12 TaxID=2979465 RepID=UPI00232AF6D0|nr:YcjX family protein [Cognatishimia sp. SS12]MDC0738233.1 YcjX family protein [Cognatishimia sp. SS12]
MIITDLANEVSKRVEAVSDGLNEALFEPVIRIGVTGLARSGKTVFITSLVANLLDRGRMPQVAAINEGRVLSAYLQPQPDVTVPRFDYENHHAALLGPNPHWPDSTRAISELRLSLKVQPRGLLAGLQRPRTVHLDIVDYPGEWLLDLGLLDKTYAAWSAEVLARLSERDEGAVYLARLENVDGSADLDEMQAQRLARRFTEYLNRARDAGYYDCTPGRFLLPGDLAGSPVLTFAPLPAVEGGKRRSLYRQMERRFEAYKARVVKPFFQDHFARIDRQVVLVDALGAIHRGPQAVRDMRNAMGEILAAFRPGRNAFLNRLLLGKRVERILFAATKADHLHHSQHGRLSAFMKALTRDAYDRAQFAGAKTHAMALASLRATVEESMTHDGRALNCVRGTLLDSGKQAAFYPGELPEDPAQLLASAQTGATEWLGDGYEFMNFAPAQLTLKPGMGPPHVRLDRAVQFLIGDRL